MMIKSRITIINLTLAALILSAPLAACSRRPDSAPGLIPTAPATMTLPASSTPEAVESLPPTSALAPTLSPTPANSEAYGALSAWVQANANYLNGLDFVEAAELADRQRPPLTPTTPPIDISTLDKQSLQGYQAEVSQYWATRLELDSPARQAPFDVEVYDVIRQDYQGAAYEIEVISWDAYPDFPVPATIYRPINAPQERLPAIVAPLGCQTNLAGHNDLYSSQELAANLALRGFLVFTVGTGLCFDGLVGEQLENSFAYEQYGRLSGSGFSSQSIALIMLTRALDYLATRSDVDMSRVGTTGYSYGGGLAFYLASYDTRISALGFAATSVSFQPNSDDRLFYDRRHPAMYSGSPDIFLTSNWPPNVFSELTPPNSLFMTLEVVLAPRPFFIVQGRDDPGTSIEGTQAFVDQLAVMTDLLDPSALPPQLVVVDGPHNYDAERRRLVTDWFASVLNAEAVLPAPEGAFEYELPVLTREVLERRPVHFGEVSIHDIHAARAAEIISRQRLLHPFNDYTSAEARALLEHLLLLPGSDEPRDGRPIMLDERHFTLETGSVSAQFWLVPLTHHLNAAALTLTPEGEAVSEADLYISADDNLMPTEATLAASLAEGRAVEVVYLPGFGPLRSTQTKTGQLAVTMPDRLDRTLLGVGVESAQAVLDLDSILYPEAVLVGYSEGVDAGNVLAFTTALDKRIRSAHLYHAVDSFLTFLTAPTNPIPAPTMAIPGLAAYVDIPDLQVLAGAGRIIIESQSDLAEYVLDLRPCVPLCPPLALSATPSP